ncbi:MAG: flagellin [Dehalococcoidia bacterium]
MNGKFSKALVKFHKGEKGITGLETAIILIAFVTVAAVLAYSVLSAGVFSSEKGQEAVFSGLEEASASMQVLGSIYALGNVTSQQVTNVSFQLGTVLTGESVDLDNITVNIQDDTKIELDVADGGLYGFSGMLAPNEVVDIDIDVEGEGFVLEPYEYFTIEIIPQTGASLLFTKWLPGEIDAVMNLH